MVRIRIIITNITGPPRPPRPTFSTRGNHGIGRCSRFFIWHFQTRSAALG